MNREVERCPNDSSHEIENLYCTEDDCHNQECVVESEAPDSYEYDDFVDRVREELSSRLVGFVPQFHKFRDDDMLIGYVEVSNYPYDEPYARLYLTLNSGYYEGSCLDFDVEVLQDKKAYMDNAVEQKGNRIKQIYRKFGKEYVVSARFSNGETMYSPKE